jgi:fatty acid desaturase
MSDALSSSGVLPTKPRRRRSDAGDGSEYAALLAEVRAAGLLRKRVGYYAAVASIVAAVGAVAVVLLLVLGPSPWQLLDAALFGIVFAQFGFLAHEAAHRQIFASGPANDLAARVIGATIVGLGYTWW